MPERQQQLAHLESLGDATQFAPQMHALIPKCPLLENFSQPEVLLLAHFMDVYRAAPGAEIIREGGQYTVRDVGSLNGTYLNRERVEDAPLRDGDELQIGSFKLVFVHGGA